MLELAQIFNEFGDDFRQRYPNMLTGVKKEAVDALVRCQTPFYGGDIYQCDKCGYAHFSYHSCKNRNCPKCARKQMDEWLGKRKTELLDCRYFHLVLTLPRQLHWLCRQHPKQLYEILMRTAFAALKKLCKDPKFVGADIGALAVLHTWTREILYHPHVHLLVPAGGIDKEGEWRPSRQDYFVPVRALSDIFQGKFKTALRRAGFLSEVDSSAWKIRWYTYAKPSVQGAEKVLEYLARYVFRTAICNSSILKIDKENKSVTFRYIDHRKGKCEKTLSALDFMRHWLQHILPKGFSRVRYYGFWAGNSRKKLASLQEQLNKSEPHEEVNEIDLENCSVEELLQLWAIEEKAKQQICPHCKKGHLQWVSAVIADHSCRGRPLLCA